MLLLYYQQCFRCDYRNFGVSAFCNLDNGGVNVPFPAIFSANVYNEYETTPPYAKKIVSDSNIRTLDSSEANTQIFRKSNDQYEYDAYDKDIVIANFYFEPAAIFQFTRDPRMTWGDFISQMGGLLGLCIGFSALSGIEFIYWFTYRLWRFSTK